MKPAVSRILDWSLYAGVAALALLFISRKMSGPDEGKAAAPFDLPIVDKPGARFRLADHRGRPVLIEVVASWCGACERAAPNIHEAWREHGNDKATFVAVTLDATQEDASRLKKSWNIPYDLAIDDGTVSKSYDIEVLPTFVLVDGEGIVRHVSTGAPSRSEVEGWLTEL